MSKFLDLNGLRYFFDSIRAQFDGRYYKQEQIDGFLSNYYTKSQIDPQMASKAPIASPDFTGTPLAPTPSSTDVSRKIATTAFVHLGLSNKSDVDHNHNSLYYTRDQVNGLLDERPRFNQTATQSTNGTMSNLDKIKVDGMAPYEHSNYTVNQNYLELTNNFHCYLFNKFETTAIVIIHFDGTIKPVTAGSDIMTDLPKAIGHPYFVVTSADGDAIPLYLLSTGVMRVGKTITTATAFKGSIAYITNGANVIL